jgi:protein-tyrosine phosphatase
MIDIHSHLIFNVDDGSRSIDESIEIIKNLYNQGVTDMILTPHYITYSRYMSDVDSNKDILKQLKSRLKEENINMNLYLGNEIFMDEHIYDLLKDNKITSLNDTKYLLIELPMSGDFNGYQDVLYSLIIKGYKVILAHPERYYKFQKDFNKIYELEEIGVLFQSNYGSILGEYGPGAKKMMKRLMKEDKITYFSTDIHHVRRHYNFIEKAKLKMKKFYEDNKIEDLTLNNAKELIK